VHQEIHRVECCHDDATSRASESANLLQTKPDDNPFPATRLESTTTISGHSQPTLQSRTAQLLFGVFGPLHRNSPRPPGATWSWSAAVCLLSSVSVVRRDRSLGWVSRRAQQRGRPGLRPLCCCSPVSPSAVRSIPNPFARFDNPPLLRLGKFLWVAQTQTFSLQTSSPAARLSPTCKGCRAPFKVSSPLLLRARSTQPRKPSVGRAR